MTPLSEFINICEGKRAIDNYRNYIGGSEPLKHAAIQHPAGDDIFDFISKSANHDFWMKNRDEWDAAQKKMRRR